MERYVLTWDSCKDDKTAVVITKIHNDGLSLLGEVVFSGIGDGAVFLDELKIFDDRAIKAELAEAEARAKRYFDEKEALLRREYERRERTIAKVERALGFKLFQWQKDYIFEGKPYGEEIYFARCAGKTLAHCLRLCLSDGDKISALLRPDRISDEFLQYLGEDNNSHHRRVHFVQTLKDTYAKLNAAGGIELREIIF